MSINTIDTPGRFANHISRKNNLDVIYSYKETFIKLNIELYIGQNVYTNNIIDINDNNFMDYINGILKITNQVRLPQYYQTREFVFYLRKHFNRTKYDENHPYKHLKNNEMLFVHVRLDDTTNYNLGINYYDKVIQNIKFTKGYISSDSPRHQL